MAIATQDVTREKRVTPGLTGTIDCDIHVTLSRADDLDSYLSSRWREHRHRIGDRQNRGSSYPRAMPNAARYDAWPPGGGPPGSNLDFLRAQLLDEWAMDYGILTPLVGVGNELNLEYGAAKAQAFNDWQLAEWVEPEPRLRGSVLVPYEDGELSATEIERVGHLPEFVQVLLIARTREPLGRRKYWKLYEAAQRLDLPIAIHFGGVGGGPITGSGWPTHYIDDHCGMPQAFQAQVISMVFEGIFERFPDLKIVLIEGGFGWLPSLMWRMDRAWEKLGSEAPDLKRPPSSYVRDHFWITTQPMEEPTQPRFFHQLLDQLNMPDRLMFATDYPHWDFDAPDRAIPVKIDSALHEAIMHANARTLYKLD